MLRSAALFTLASAPLACVVLAACVDARPVASSPALAAPAPMTERATAPTSASSLPAAWFPPDGGTDASRADLAMACDPVVQLVMERAALDEIEARDGGRARRMTIQSVLSRVAPDGRLPDARLSWCRDALMRQFGEESEESDARSFLNQAAWAVRMIWSRGSAHRLCPSARPVPASLDALDPGYTSRAEDWSLDPGWSCLEQSFRSRGPQRFQCEVKVDPRYRTFEVIARRRVPGGIRVLTISGDVRRDGPTQDNEVHVRFEPTPSPAERNGARASPSGGPR